MKILMVSIFSPHFFNWTEQLKDSGHEIYWLDIFDSKTKVEKLHFVHQISGWRYKVDFPGRYVVKKIMPWLNKLINRINEKKIIDVFEQKLKEIRPDVVHSFVMYLGAAPFLNLMKEHPEIKWIYSSWGSDLYYYRHLEKEAKGIKQTLPFIDYLFTDCKRDRNIAVENGFDGDFLGVFPGGGGFDFSKLDPFIQEFGERKVILIKGYQGLHGKSITVLQSILQILKILGNYKIVVFGADKEVIDFVDRSDLIKFPNFECLARIDHLKVLELMGSSIMYIGNSTSDGMPNTLLEAIVMGAFPIQSNPGGVTEEIIENRKNGLLINDPEDPASIASMIKYALNDKNLLRTGIEYNNLNIRPNLERSRIKEQVLKKYGEVEMNLNK